MLLSMGSCCALGYFRMDILVFFRIIALDLVKIYDILLVSQVTKNVFDLES
jgi:hypothetical protein